MVFKSQFADVEPDERFKGLVSNFFWHQLDVFAERTLFVDHQSGREWTGARIKATARTIAQNLACRLQLGANFDCVSFYYNRDHLQLASLAVLFAGGSVCAGAPEDPEPEHAHMLEVMQPALVLTELRLLDEMLAIKRNSSGRLAYQLLVVMDDQQLSDTDWAALVAKAAGATCRLFGFERHLCVSNLNEDADVAVAAAAAKLQLPVQVHPDRPAFVLLTSGSTGRPKPVGRSQRNSLYVCHCLDGEPGSKLWNLNANTVLAGHLQLDHGTGTFNLKLTLAKGCKMILMHGYEYAAFLEAVRQHRITDACLGSALIHNLVTRAMSDDPAESLLANNNTMTTTTTTTPCAPNALDSLLNLMAVGSPIANQQLVDEFMARFKHCNVRQAYGMTECGFIAITARDEPDRKSGVVGTLLPNFELKLVARLGDQAGSEIGALETEGELYVRGPTVSPGYLGAQFAEQSRASFLADGFYKSNDICLILQGTRLKIRGRYSEILCLHDGWKVLPSELEHVLVAHPLVKEASVFGIPHPELPTCHAPRAYVVPKDGVEADFDADFERALAEAQAGKQLDEQLGQQLARQAAASRINGAQLLATPATGAGEQAELTARKLTVESLFRYTADRMAEPKHLIGGIRFLRQLPKISIGKCDKKLLRKLDGFL